MRKEIINECHDANLAGGHWGLDKTEDRVAAYFWWPYMRTTISSYIQQCESCQRSKPSNQKPAGLLQPLPITDYPWQQVTMDFMTLPASRAGFGTVFVVVDRLTKMCHFIPTHKTAGALAVAHLFYDHIVRLHGVLEAIISDRAATTKAVRGLPPKPFLGVRNRRQSLRQMATHAGPLKARKGVERSFHSPVHAFAQHSLCGAHWSLQRSRTSSMWRMSSPSASRQP